MEINRLSDKEMVALYNELGSFTRCARRVGCSLGEWTSKWFVKNCEKLIEEGVSFGRPDVTCRNDHLNSCPSTILDNSTYVVNTSCNYEDYNIVDDNNWTKVENIRSWAKVKEADSERYSIAVISDTHFGSKFQAKTALDRFVEICQERGITTLLHGGDVSEGIMPRTGAKNDRFLHSIDELTDYCIDNYPHGFEKSYFILGNHDDSLGRRMDGFDIGRAIAKERSDLTYLPLIDSLNDVCVVDGGARVQLYHGIGGCSKNRSMRIQNKLLEMIHMGVTVDFMMLGHCHVSSYVPNYYGVHVYGLGSFQSYTPFLSMKGMKPDVCGMIVSYEMFEGHPVNVGTEFMFVEQLGGLHKEDY